MALQSVYFAPLNLLVVVPLLDLVLLIDWPILWQRALRSGGRPKLAVPSSPKSRKVVFCGHWTKTAQASH
jgi:hypothetical protein